MSGTPLLILALLFAPPSVEQPEIDEGDAVQLEPEGWSPFPNGVRTICVLYLVKPRHSFFEVMTHQAAGMLGTPVAPQPPSSSATSPSLASSASSSSPSPS